MNNGLRELRHLLHAKREGPEFAITRFAEAYVEERFVCAFERLLGRQSGKFRAEADEGNRRHIRYEAVVLRHVADECTNLADLRADVETHHPCGACGGFPKTENCADQRAFACAVGSEQPDGAAAAGAAG